MRVDGGAWEAVDSRVTANLNNGGPHTYEFRGVTDVGVPGDPVRETVIVSQGDLVALHHWPLDGSLGDAATVAPVELVAAGGLSFADGAQKHARGRGGVEDATRPVVAATAGDAAATGAVLVGKSPLLKPGDRSVVGAWVMPTAVSCDGSFHAAVTFTNAGKEASAIGYVCAAGGVPVVAVQTPAGVSQFPAHNFTVNGWTQITMGVGTQPAGAASLFVNGTTVEGAPALGAADDLVLGGRGDKAPTWAGRIDDVRVYVGTSDIAVSSGVGTTNLAQALFGSNNQQPIVVQLGAK